MPTTGWVPRTIALSGTGLAPLSPTVSLNWINLVRPTSGTATATFTLSLSAPSPTATSVTVRTLDGTATVAAGDYVPITKQLVTFAPGQTTATVSVTVNGKSATHSYFGLQTLAPYTGLVIQNDYGRANLLGPDRCGPRVRLRRHGCRHPDHQRPPDGIRPGHRQPPLRHHHLRGQHRRRHGGGCQR